MKFVIETGTFADAVQAAAKFTNSKETLYTGVMVQHRSTRIDEGLMVQATNGDVTFRRTLTPEEISFEENDRRQMYFPAKLASKLLPKFPLGAESFLEIESKDRECTITCGRIRVKLNLLDPDVFPGIPVYGTEELGEVEGLAQRLKQVSFAADKKGIKSGLHIDGEHLICVSTGLLARAKCKVPVEHPVTLPISMLGSILRNTDVIHIGERDKRFILQTDVDTQIITTVMLDPYPDTNQFMAIREKHLDRKIGFDKLRMKDSLVRMLALADEDELPRLRMYLREDRIDLQMEVKDVGEILDFIEAWCEKPTEQRYAMTPSYLLDIINVWPTSMIEMEFNGEKSTNPFCCEHKGLFIMWMGFYEK